MKIKTAHTPIRKSEKIILAIPGAGESAKQILHHIVGDIKWHNRSGIQLDKILVNLKTLAIWPSSPTASIYPRALVLHAAMILLPGDIWLDLGIFWLSQLECSLNTARIYWVEALWMLLSLLKCTAQSPKQRNS